MARTRLIITVESTLLNGARSARPGMTDAVLIDEALSTLLARHRATQVDASYVAYDEHPLDEPDEWGDLASFRRAAGASRACSPPAARCSGARWPRSAGGPWSCQLGTP